jgi:hypothetical protein
VIVLGAIKKLLRTRAVLCTLVFWAPAGVVLGAASTPPASASFDFRAGSFESTFLNEDGTPDVQAGSHPFALNTSFKFNTTIGAASAEPIPDGSVKDVEVQLPVGVVGNATATPRCSIALFNTPNTGEAFGLSGASCPNDTQVGVAQVEITPNGEGEPVPLTLGIYNLVAPPGVPAEFGFNPIGVAVVLTPTVRTATDYGVTVSSRNTNQTLRIFGVKTTFWGVPAAASHNGERGECLGGLGEKYALGVEHPCPVEIAPTPFLTLPTSCQAAPLTSTIYADSWESPVQGPELVGLNPPLVARAEAFNHDLEGHPAGIAGCEHLDFSPTVNISPTTTDAGSPTGLSAEISLPRNEAPGGLAESALKQATVSLPAGMSVSPSAANGLEACTEEAIALRSAAPASCPSASKLGTVEIETPLLEHPLTGSVYLAQQEHNPFGSLLALYVVAEGSGVVVKLAGEVKADPVTGQLTTTFAGNPPFEGAPQQPFSHLRLTLFSGPRAALMTPLTCGPYGVVGTLTPWSGAAPVAFSDPFAITSNCGGGFSPSLLAGTTSNQAGGFSPFSLTLSRSDADQRLRQLSVRTPPGFEGMLSRVQLCGEPQAAEGKCPEASRIGHVTVGAGPGPEPVFVPQAGKPLDPVYLTGPYGGAPFGLSIVVAPAAGPFNLGPPVVVRSAIHVDPRTAQITIASDPFPTILKGIPLDVRTFNVLIDREGFAFNPTNCEPLQVEGTVLSDQGATAQVSSRFQAANCATLPFKPSFKALTKAHPSHALGASLTVKVGYPRGTYPLGHGQANIAEVKVSLPKQLPSRLTTLQQACPEATFAANPATCPPASMVGVATASTPVLNVPVAGPAYLVSHGGAAFPDLIIILQGQGVTVELVGNTNIDKAGITTSTFASVPDVPISSFEVNLPQGPHSALTENLPKKSKGSYCSSKLVMPTTITAQNGLQIKQSTKISVTGCPKVKKKKKKAKARAKRHKRK